MELKKFAQEARRQLLEQVAARVEQVLRTDSIEIREKVKAVKQLREEIKASSEAAVVDKVAYTWFNRFCALRFMDVNHYTRIGVVSPVEGFTQPEVLGEAKLGVIDESFGLDQARVFALLNGQIPSSNPQQEAYRLLLKGACNAWHAEMPFLFPEIEDYTELLMPDDLLSENSVLHSMRQALNEAACQDVEVIGWLYQYYISERKDEVFAGLKKRKKIEAEDIPAATQLFTPHWIVRYLVENSLGRLWMLNHPESKLAEGMDYYIAPEEEESDFLEIASPEEIKFCDPACGSGHILTYAFDLLYAIYEEQGYDSLAIPSLILKNNIYGIEIDERAGNLAAFALTMKARAKDRRFFKRDVEPNLCVLGNVRFTAKEIDEYMDVVGRDLFTQDLWQTLRQFEQAENFGSLIRPALKDIAFVRERLEEKGIFENLFLHDTNKRVKRVLEMAEYLSPQYHIVVANPPYMGGAGMNEDLKGFAKNYYPNSKSDTYSMFVQRNLKMVSPNGFVGMITIPSWMFISSFEKFRKDLLRDSTFISLIHNGRGVWGSDFGSCSFVIMNSVRSNYIGSFKRLFIEQGKIATNDVLSKRFHDDKSFPFYFVSSAKFKNVPGSPIAYWASDQIIQAFSSSKLLSNVYFSDGANKTGNNEKYLRYFWEVTSSSIYNQEQMTFTWLLCAKGGDFRRWYGNIIHVINWLPETREHFSKDKVARLLNEKYWYKEGITWGRITPRADIGFRYLPDNATFETAGTSIFPRKELNSIPSMLSLLSSKVMRDVYSILNPTVVLQVGDVLNVPYKHISDPVVSDNGNRLIEISKRDWDQYEISWDFKNHPLLSVEQLGNTTEKNFIKLRDDWNQMVLEMKELEEENNSIFIELYELQNELFPTVAIEDISLTCNPNFRYGNKKSATELETLLLEDTMKEFISYAVGCMLGRYSLDKPGLILANAGETQEDYLRQVPDPSFMPDDDNVIPILAGEWFEDDIAERFKQFLKVTFGKEHYEENLAFIEDAIGKDIRAYFVKDFYKNHVKMYKKRPIYWQFSSAKGSFNALIYMHRYRPDTVSVILNGYLRQYREKLRAHKSMLEARAISGGASQSEKTKALREIDKINKVLAELREYEDEILYPLAIQQIDIDLDDGVKVNYPKFGAALKKVSGLSG